jgi:hypothetical protein
LADVSRADFSAAAGLPVEALTLIEASGSARVHSEQDIEALNRALACFGVIIVEESHGMGAGVRLKFTRQDVKQIDRLESEGGVVAADDVP